MVKIVNAHVLATTVCQLVNNSLSTLCASCVCLRVCASCQTPPQTWPRLFERGHELPVRLPRPALFRHIAQTSHQRQADLPHLSRDSHGGKRKNRVFCCWTRPGVCISPGMIQALPRIKGGRFSSRQGKMELRKTLCSTTLPLIHHPLTPPPLSHLLTFTTIPCISPVHHALLAPCVVFFALKLLLHFLCNRSLLKIQRISFS